MVPLAQLRRSLPHVPRFRVLHLLISAVTTCSIVYGAFYFIHRAHDADLPTTRAIVIGGRDVSYSVASILRVISLVASAGIAITTGSTMMAQWPARCRREEVRAWRPCAIYRVDRIRAEVLSEGLFSGTLR
jgi:hypothetical protein